MSFRIGDYVRFVNERQEGVVTSLVDHRIVGVTIDGDFEIQVAVSEIVKVNATEQSLIDSEEQAPLAHKPIVKKDNGVFVAAVSNPKAASLFDLYLLNETAYEVLFSCSEEEQGHYTGSAFGHVAAFGICQLHTFTASEGFPPLYFQLIFHGKESFQPRQPILKRFQPKAKALFGKESLIPLLKRDGFIWPLDIAENTIATDKLQQHFNHSNTKEQQSFFVPEEEVDLHIEALREDWPKMSGEEILRYQLEHFRRCLEAAAAKGFEKIIFIHGVGNGTLRTEIHKRLGKELHVKTFKDARKEKFGYGATEVWLK